jgi:flagellar biosynthesis protein FliQ
MDGKQHSKIYLTVKDITLIAMLSAILFIQEEALTFIPNIQLTIFLIVLYSKKLKFYKTTIIVACHVVLDNIFMGSFNLFYTPTMFIGWMFLPIFIKLFCKKIENPFLLGLVGALGGFVYSWMYILPNYFIYNINPLIYLSTDYIFELILAGCGFITVLLLYKPCAKLFDLLKIN